MMSSSHTLSKYLSRVSTSAWMNSSTPSSFYVAGRVEVKVQVKDVNWAKVKVIGSSQAQGEEYE